MQDRDKWINRVMRSMEDSRPAAPPPQLYDLIRKRITRQSSDMVSQREWRAVAVAMTLLLLLNALVLRKTLTEFPTGQQEVVAEVAVPLSFGLQAPY